MKKLIILAAALSLGASASAFAADSTCGSVPAAPALPDAATAKPAEVNAAGKEIEAYATNMDKWQGCLGTYLDSEIKKSNEVIDNYTKLVAAVKERTTKK